MKKFSFSMEKILDIRTFEKKQAESELSMAMMKEREIQAQIDSLTEKRGALKECIKKEKALEKLKEKKYEEWKKEIKKEEQKEMDEIVNVLIRH